MGVGQEPRRTQALRAPGEGVYTPPQSVAASNPCLNCGTNVQLEYCPECGQRASDTDPSLREFLNDLAQEIWRWDGKLFNTFRTLIAKPGVLTLEYHAGRRVRYISPLRMYLACGIVFFLLSAVLPLPVWETFTGSPRLDRVLAATPRIPLFVFLLAPLFAALVRVVYRDRRRQYPQHLAFAMHAHAMFLIGFTLMLAGDFLPSFPARAVFSTFVSIALAVHLVRATRVVYEGSLSQTISRVFIVSAMYLAAIGVLLGLTIIAS